VLNDPVVPVIASPPIERRTDSHVQTARVVVTALAAGSNTKDAASSKAIRSRQLVSTSTVSHAHGVTGLHSPQVFERAQDSPLNSVKMQAVTQPQQKHLQSRLSVPVVTSPNLRSRMSHFNYDGGDDDYGDDNNGNHDNTDNHDEDDENAASDARAADTIDVGNVPAHEKRVQLSSVRQLAAPFRPSMSAFISQLVERGSEKSATLAPSQGSSVSVPSSRRAAPFSPRS
jgi:hypothetical protein